MLVRLAELQCCAQYNPDLNKTRLEQTRSRQTDRQGGREGDNVVTQLDHTGTKDPLLLLHYAVHWQYCRLTLKDPHYWLTNCKPHS